MTTILDPTGERQPVTRQRSARPASLDGLTVGLLDITKPRGTSSSTGSRSCSSSGG